MYASFQSLCQVSTERVPIHFIDDVRLNFAQKGIIATLEYKSTLNTKVNFRDIITDRRTSYYLKKQLNVLKKCGYIDFEEDHYYEIKLISTYSKFPKYGESK